MYSQDSLRNYEEEAGIILQKIICRIWHYVLVCVYAAAVRIFLTVQVER
jgi:hypothetical protein